MSLLVCCRSVFSTGARCAGARWRSAAAAGAAAAGPARAARPLISKVVVANRGEIACRVMRTARRLGVRTVALYSDADRDALHVAMADEAYHIGGAAAADSYLRGERVLEVARASGAQAVHPGYGFLSENLEFCEQCRERGVVFIGPPPAAIRDMGIKSTSKAIMAAAGVPIVEGYHGDNQNEDFLWAEARRIGFPLMVKAVRGGGGKGMRIAQTAEEFGSALASARQEAVKSFGDGAVLLERYIAAPRHVEVQVFADAHGQAVYLFERDCSVQRRHQKVIEEAPAPGLSESTRAKLGAAAVRAALAVGYEGAGTVEFILDRHTHSFHFCEMNTRLQVEHPITEMITGTDLVEWQLRVASGEPLPLTQEEIIRRGHAFECRIYAEEPRANFLPRAGTLKHLRQPFVSPSETDVRVETGVRQGDDVSVHYDPMIAKLVVWGPDRTRALARMHAELARYQVVGVETNIEFLMSMCKEPAFQAGDVHTGFIEEHRASLLPPPRLSRESALRAAVALVLLDQTPRAQGTPRNPPPTAWRPNYTLPTVLQLSHQGQEVKVEIERRGDAWRARLGAEDAWSEVRAQVLEDGQSGHVLRASVDGHGAHCGVLLLEDEIRLYEKDGATVLERRGKQRAARGARGGGGASGVEGASPTPGVLERLLVRPGDAVQAGAPLFTVIAMKMEYTVRATRAATVTGVAAQLLGAPVRRGQPVVTLQDMSELSPPPPPPPPAPGSASTK